MRMHTCNEYHCDHEKVRYCEKRNGKCHGDRYVRADVAKRYARAAYNHAINKGRKFWYDVVDYNCLKRSKITEPKTYEEAIAERGGKNDK